MPTVHWAHGKSTSRASCRSTVFRPCDHIASPDVHVDEEARQIVIYVHGVDARGGSEQVTVRCTSADGLHFTGGETPLGTSYFRVFRHDGYWYALANTGRFYRATDPAEPWTQRPERLIPSVVVDDAHGRRENVRMRHAAILHRGDHLLVFYTRKDDAPERILCARVDLKGDWTQWAPSEPIEVLRPAYPYEGVDLPIRVSEMGAAEGPVHEVRDPCIFVEGDKVLLYYSVAGESGLAAATLSFPTATGSPVD